MGWLDWLTKRGGERRALDEWHEAWTAALATPDAERVRDLQNRLARLDLPEEEVEIEREMLDGLDALVTLQGVIASTGLPVVETGHRVVGRDTPHFIAPASMPDDPVQPSGRLILTAQRAIFAGGGRTATMPWHGVAETVHAGRDIVLVRIDRESTQRFRCNSYADALCGAFLARHLTAGRRRGGRPGAPGL